VYDYAIVAVRCRVANYQRKQSSADELESLVTVNTKLLHSVSGSDYFRRSRFIADADFTKIDVRRKRNLPRDAMLW